MLSLHQHLLLLRRRDQEVVLDRVLDQEVVLVAVWVAVREMA